MKVEQLRAYRSPGINATLIPVPVTVPFEQLAPYSHWSSRVYRWHRGRL